MRPHLLRGLHRIGGKMLVGVPREIKSQESRVGLTPAAVREYVLHGHQVIVEKNASAAMGTDDAAYVQAGAAIVDTAAEIFTRADMIVKVKEPQPEECAMLRAGQILFTYLHLAADPVQAKGLIRSGCVAIAYETVTGDDQRLPLLAPMSEVAGRMAAHVGAYYLHTPKGGAGVLMGGVPGVAPAEVLVLGGGVAGTHAAKVAIGMGARVTIVEKNLARIRQLDDLFGQRANIIYSTQSAIEKYAARADLVLGAVLVPGARAPKLVTRDLLSRMKPRTVIVDIAIDQGGCTETSRPTTHENPVFTIDGILHYCVANMPGAVPRTSAQALNNAALPYGLRIADLGWKEALRLDPHLQNGLNVCAGKITHPDVARDLGLDYTPVTEML